MPTWLVMLGSMFAMVAFFYALYALVWLIRWSIDLFRYEDPSIDIREVIQTEGEDQASATG